MCGNTTTGVDDCCIVFDARRSLDLFQLRLLVRYNTSKCTPHETVRTAVGTRFPESVVLHNIQCCAQSIRVALRCA